MYEEINVEKEAMNQLLHSKLFAQKDIGGREDEVIEELDKCGCDTASLDMVSMWLINPGLPGVEESPATKAVPMATWSGCVSIDSESTGSPVRRTRKKKAQARSRSRSGSRQGGRSRHSGSSLYDDRVPESTVPVSRKSTKSKTSRPSRSQKVSSTTAPYEKREERRDAGRLRSIEKAATKKYSAGRADSPRK